MGQSSIPSVSTLGLFCLAVVAIQLFSAGVNAHYGTKIEWNEYDQGLALAKKTNRPAMVSGCSHKQRLNRIRGVFPAIRFHEDCYCPLSSVVSHLLLLICSFRY